jgi:hypothetical protein
MRGFFNTKGTKEKNGKELLWKSGNQGGETSCLSEKYVVMWD